MHAVRVQLLQHTAGGEKAGETFPFHTLRVSFLISEAKAIWSGLSAIEPSPGT